MEFFFDSHLHPTLKKQFARPGATGNPPMFNPWRTAVRQDFLRAFNDISLRSCLIRPFVESTLVSQASLSQLAASGYALGMMVLFFPDKGLLRLILRNEGFRSIIDHGLFGDIIVPEQLDALLNTQNAFAVLQHDLELLRLTDGPHQARWQTSSSFQPGPDPAFVFSVEGLHCLRTDLAETRPDTILQDISANLDLLANGNVPVISVNIAHIDDSNELFANQAYAADGFREAGFQEQNLRPKGNGLTSAGKSAVQMLYGRDLLPDVKHMSFTSRQQLYAFRRQQGITQPIVCSHAGFTGCWFDANGESLSDFILDIKPEGSQKRLVLGKPNPYLDDQQIGFNASTINLFNEDIEEIFQSGGLIGLSMDQRILGYSEILNANVATVSVGAGHMALLTDSDFISSEEADGQPVFQTAGAVPAKIIRGVRPELRETGNSTDVRDFFHPRHFYLHVVHAMVVAGFLGGEAAVSRMLTRTLCIGSDFDGLIDGIDCCRNVTETASFKRRFIVEFPRFLQEVRLSLPAGLSIETVADRLFYENGRDFVLSRLS